ncbi:MAG: phage portal protein [Rhodospirillaceae bacterium]|nr:phage portal protein [Rhodospirillaceae bacterium]|tara:strand:- start:1115 stop:3427 length:2313 start_codon:yes stop_codon:yes gene_type:complete
MGFLDGLNFTGHNREGWERNISVGGKAFYYNENMGRLNPIEGGKKKAYKDDWDVDRAVSEGNDRVTWVYKSVYAIASNAARLPVEVLDEENEAVSNPLLPILNRKANPHHDAYNFRFQLSSQVLLSKRGAFIEIVKDRLDNVVGLYLLPPNWTFPIPDPKKFVSGYSVQVPNTKERIVKPEDVVWVRIPHPTDPYRGQSPLEACGLAIDIDYYSRIYNRNFMVNDGRPGGILMVQGELDDDSADEIRRRFLGNTGSALGGAGRMTIMEAEQAKWIDTSIGQRDAQYTETKQLAKEEILMAFGVPESVIGNASERTFANADTELEVFWRETMLPHLMLIERAFDRLDGSDELTVKFNLDDVAILSRDERERAAYHLEELKFGAISIDEYRQKTGREPVGADLMWIQANLMPIGQAVADGETPSSEFSPPQLEDGQPGVLMPHAPMVNPPVEPSEVVPEAASLNGAVEEKSEGKESTPLDSVWGFSSGETFIDEKAADQIRGRRDQQMMRLSESISLQLGAYFQRQKRVVLEKWNGKKIREKVNKGIAVSVNDILDIPKWDRQLVADAKTFLMATIIDGGNEVALITGKQIDPDEELVAAGVIAGLTHVEEINRTTRKHLEEKINEGLALGKSVDDIAAEIEDVYAKAMKNRARVAASNIVAFGVNQGQMIHALKEGYSYKVWLSQQDEKVRATHTHADGQAVPIEEPFSVGGYLMMHPGAQTASIKETANCRCTMVFTNNPSEQGLLQFGLDRAEIANLRDSEALQAVFSV